MIHHSLLSLETKKTEQLFGQADGWPWPFQVVLNLRQAIYPNQPVPKAPQQVPSAQQGDHYRLNF